MAKVLVGRVSSDKVDKTIVVTVVTKKTHPLYKKQFSVSHKFMAHDEQNEANLGDRVSIIETRPISARKRFKLDSVLEKAPVRHVEPEPVVEDESEPKQPAAANKPKKAEKVTDEPAEEDA